MRLVLLLGAATWLALVSKALARPVSQPTQEQVRTDESMPSSMTRMFQQFALGRRRPPPKHVAAANPWRRWAPLLGCCAAVAVLLIVAVMLWPSGKSESPKVAQIHAEKKALPPEAKTKDDGHKPDPIAELMAQKRREQDNPAPPPTPKPKPEPKPEPKPPTPDDNKPEPAEKAEARLKVALAEAKTPADYRAVAKGALRAANEAADSGNKDFGEAGGSSGAFRGREGERRRTGEQSHRGLSPDREPKLTSSSISSTTWNSRGILYQESGRSPETASATHPRAAKIA